MRCRSWRIEPCWNGFPGFSSIYFCAATGVSTTNFKARYDLCRGPFPSLIATLEGFGCEVCEYQGFFGHGCYSRKLKFLDKVEKLKTRALLQPIPLLTTYVTVILKKAIAE